MVLSQKGEIRIIANDSSARAPVFLDLSTRVSTRNNEEGLLGLAFHPNYRNTGYFYVFYSSNKGPRHNVLSRFKVTANPGHADPASEVELLAVPKNFGNHNGGMLAFGPDGYLYLSLGDGGGGGDPDGNGQKLSTVYGKILRLDVTDPEALPYRIPPDNPFVGPGASPGARPEIWAYGLRNTWRFSFDRETGELWAGDVGQNRLEEIDIIRKGGNYGWSIMEGTSCFRLSTNCAGRGLVLPVMEYGRDEGCSVTGGYVYRGQTVPWLRGAYVYADFCSGLVWALRHRDGSVVAHRQIADSGLMISSFGEDSSGELYLTTFDGRVYRIKDGG